MQKKSMACDGQASGDLIIVDEDDAYFRCAMNLKKMANLDLALSRNGRNDNLREVCNSL